VAFFRDWAGVFRAAVALLGVFTCIIARMLVRVWYGDQFSCHEALVAFLAGKAGA